MQAHWATRGWAVAVANILNLLGSDDVMFRLRAETDPESAKKWLHNARAMFKLVVNQASQRAWSMASWSELPPHSWAGVLHQDVERAKQAKKQLQNDYECVDKALRCMETANGKQARRSNNTFASIWLMSILGRSGLSNLLLLIRQAVSHVIADLWVHRLTLNQDNCM